MKPARWRDGAVVVLAALLAGLPYLSGRVPGGHDSATYLMYGAQVLALWRDGVFLPAWGPELNAGFGGPGLLFYPPLANALHALAALPSIPLPLATGLVGVGALAASGLALLAFARRSGAGESALPAAILYVVSPYRMVDLYERSALSENLAFLFPPLVLAALSSPSLPPRRRVLLVALGTAGLALSNLPAALLGGLVLAAWSLSPEGRPRLPAAAAGALLGGALSAFALLPASLAGRWTATELYYSGSSGLFRPSEHVLFGPATLNPGFGRRVSVTFALLGVAAAVAWLAARSTPRRGARAFWGGVAAVAVVAALPPAGPAWDAAPLLSKLQFPWRGAFVLTLALSALASLAPRCAAWGLAVAAAVAAVPSWGRLAFPWEPAPVPPPAATATRFPEPSVVRDAAGNSANPWARNPNLVDLWFVPRVAGESAGGAAGREKAAALPSLPALAAAPVASREGSVSFEPIAWRASLRRVGVEAPAGRLLLRSFSFPGLAVRLDGRDVPALADAETGLLAVAFPGGRHVVEWSWRPFPPLGLARAVSGAALLLLLLLALLPAPRRAGEAPRS